MFEAIAFYLFAFLSLGAFFIVVSTNNLLYALTALASGMIFISSFFFILGAEFLGVVQIAVYTGAVIVLYAFGLMFLDISSDIKEHYCGQIRLCIMVFLIALLLLALFGFPIYHHNVMLEKSTIIANEPNAFGIGRGLFSKYLIAFEITGVLLLVALIGGVALGMQKRKIVQNSFMDFIMQSGKSLSTNSINETQKSNSTTESNQSKKQSSTITLQHPNNKEN